MLYFYLKLLHVLAVIIFLGNIITGLFWMRLAVKTKDLKIISHSINGVIRSDRLFTVPGVVFIIAAGIFTAIFGHYPLIHTGWILWSIILFSVSGISFGWKIAPLQKKLSRLASTDNSKPFNWTVFMKVFKEWEFWGLIALITPLLAMCMMVLKLPR